MTINTEPEVQEQGEEPGLGMDLSTTDKTSVTARVNEIARLRVFGLTYQQIADRLGYANRDGPRRILMKHLREQAAEAISEMRAMENARLDAATFSVMTILQGQDAGQAERLRAADTLVRISQRRASLNGLDAPISVDITNSMQAALAELESLVLGEVVQGQVVSRG